jgi:hypothetical protein
LRTIRRRHRIGQPSVQTLARLLAVMGERLSLDSAQVAGNQPLSQLRADYEQLTASERLTQTARLSRTLTGIMAAHGSR